MTPKNLFRLAAMLPLIACSLLAPSAQAADWRGNETRLTPWRFWQDIGTDGTTFCGLSSSTPDTTPLSKTIQIKSFNGKPNLSIDLYVTGWTMPNKTHVPVSFNATSPNPLILDTTSVSTVLDMALPRYQLPNLLAALDIPQVLRIEFPSLDVPAWLIVPSVNQSEIHKFVRCLNKQPALRGLQ